MRYLALIIMLVSGANTFAKKDTTYFYYDENWGKSNKRKFDFYRKCWENPDGTIGVEEGTQLRVWRIGSYQSWNFEKEHGYFRIFDYDKKILQEGNYVEGKKNGAWKMYYPNGNKRELSHYEMGEKEGVFKSWYADGQPEISGEFHDDKYEGPYKEWYLNGQLKKEGEYLYGAHIGQWFWWYENGQMREKGIFDLGVKNGSFEGWFENGQLEYTGNFHKGDKHGIWQGFYQDGSKDYYSTYDYGKITGQSTTWYPDGTVSSSGTFDQGRAIGSIQFFHPNGQLAAEEFYENGDRTAVKWYYDNGMEKEYTGIDMIDPSFPGGDKEMAVFINEHMKYPEDARNRYIDGTVYIRFTVDFDGSIKDISVAKGVHELLDNEAMRIIKAMPNWNPGIHHNRPVSVQYTVSISFRLT